ncbi:hypothetical protein FK220_014470 [Flavobacteriaceae bacterium TP-CH-4]|uniref:Uncharacterized protein n=1 Tax=Pelagihabitans pacificus TaxID=2696054 RepID=A0A967EBR3_9FLAO|nr:hypothetical protein [Pelagihabitans pacificus]NHF60556.1 hypothetical protein [Pelagihabitans pacificus]
MMKVAALIVGLLFSILPVPDISEVRQSYREASTDGEAATRLYQDLSTISKGEDDVLIAYKGGVTTMLAKYAKTVKEKKMFFKEGITFLEYAVEKAPNNIEIRYVRLSVKENAPKITGYKKNLDEDKDFILNHLSSVENPEIKKYIKGYISQSKIFNESEKQSVLDD